MKSPAFYLLRKLETIFVPSEDERKAIEKLPHATQSFRKGQFIINEGDNTDSSFVVLEGVTAMMRVTGAGKRQIAMVHFAGDIPDMHSLYLPRADCDITVLKSATVAFMPHKPIIELCDRYPRIKDAFWRGTLVDAAILRANLINVGQRPAQKRIAHFMCEMVVRMKLAGLGTTSSSIIPLTQTEIGDCVGLGSIHVNKSVQSLQRAGLLSLKRTALKIPDWRALQEAADFSPGYLHLTTPQLELLRDTR